jgi:hypothetical protein
VDLCYVSVGYKRDFLRGAFLPFPFVSCPHFPKCLGGIYMNMNQYLQERSGTSFHTLGGFDAGAPHKCRGFSAACKTLLL